MRREIFAQWSILSQPSGSPPVSFVNSPNLVTYFSGLVEGNYLVRFDVTNALSLTSSDTIEIKVMPDSLKGITRIYDNLTWTFYPDDGWGKAVTLWIKEPGNFIGRNETTTQITAWDVEKQEWIAPDKYSWIGANGGIYIYYNDEPIESMTGKKAKVQVKFL